MSYAIDTDGTRRVGTTLATTGAELRDCSTAFAYAAGLVRAGIADDQPALAASLHDFLAIHLRALAGMATGFEALAGRLTWTALSAHEVELAAAAELGRRASSAAAGCPRPDNPSAWSW